MVRRSTFRVAVAWIGATVLMALAVDAQRIVRLERRVICASRGEDEEGGGDPAAGRRLGGEGGPGGCVEALEAERAVDRDFVLQCVDMCAVLDGLLGIGYSCPPDRSSACVKSVDDFPGELPDWTLAPWVRDAEQLPAFGWHRVLVLIMATDGELDPAQLDGIGRTWAQRLGDEATIVVVGGRDTVLPLSLRNDRRVTLLQWPPSSTPSSSSPFSSSSSSLSEEGEEAATPDGEEKLHAVLAYLHANFPGFAFLVKVEGSTLLVPIHLLQFLESLLFVSDPTEPVLFGRALCTNHTSSYPDEADEPWCYLLGSFGMNRLALQLLVARMDASYHSRLGTVPRGDLVVTQYLANEGMVLLHCPNFRTHSPAAYLAAYPGLPSRAVRILLQDILAPGVISFENLTPSAMDYADAFLYDSPATDAAGATTTTAATTTTIPRASRATLRRDLLTDVQRVWTMVEQCEQQRRSAQQFVMECRGSSVRIGGRERVTND